MERSAKSLWEKPPELSAGYRIIEFSRDPGWPHSIRLEDLAPDLPDNYYSYVAIVFGLSPQFGLKREFLPKSHSVYSDTRLVDVSALAQDNIIEAGGSNRRGKIRRYFRVYYVLDTAIEFWEMTLSEIREYFS